MAPQAQPPETEAGILALLLLAVRSFRPLLATASSHYVMPASQLICKAGEYLALTASSLNVAFWVLLNALGRRCGSARGYPEHSFVVSFTVPLTVLRLLPVQTPPNLSETAFAMAPHPPLRLLRSSFPRSSIQSSFQAATAVEAIRLKRARSVSKISLSKISFV